MTFALEIVHMGLVFLALTLHIKLSLILKVAFQGLLDLIAQHSRLSLQVACHLIPELVNVHLVLLDCKVRLGHVR